MWWAGLLVSSVVAVNAPYVRTHTTDADSHCLWWPGPEVVLQQSFVGDPLVGNAVFASVTNAIGSWEVAMQECGNLTLTEGARTGSRRAGVETTGPNTNTLLFRLSSCSKKVAATNPCWAKGTCGNDFDCWDHTAGLLGVTTVSFNTDTGEVFDADIEFNAADNFFTTVDLPVCTAKPTLSCVATDVQNTATHELGHLLGLSHTDHLNSTMNATAAQGETSKRALDPGTHSFVCEAYPAGSPPIDCVGGPVSLPSDAGVGPPPPKTGCASTAGAPWLLLLLVWGLVKRGRAAGLTVALLAALPAQATTLLELDVEALTQLSDVVVHARVGRVTARWSDDGARIFTEVELVPLETWKGTTAGPLLATQPGGVVGHVGQRVEGVARFTPGEEVVVFLEARGPRFTVAGLSQGRFALEHAPEGLVARQSDTSASFVDRFTGDARPHAPVVLPLPALKARVQAAARPAP
jgi:hypothetical protein